MEHTIPPGTDTMSLKTYLPQALGACPAWALRHALKQRDVKRDGKRLSPDTLVRAGDHLILYLPKAALGRTTEISIVYQDEAVVLVEKPQGVASKQNDGTGDSVEGLLMAQQGLAQVWACHRLDVNTGGLLLLAKHAQTFALLKEAFANGQVQKTYTCRVVGTPQPGQAVAQAFLSKDAKAARVRISDTPFGRAKPIRTAYRVLAPGPVSRLSVDLLTGRTHQIRAHLSHLGWPVLGDDKYGDRAANRRYHVTRQQLWATKIAFSQHLTVPSLQGKTFEVDAPF